MADVMLQLGDYAFSIDTAAYQRLTRSSRYTWSAQRRVGNQDALQFTGYGADSITLTGRVYPGWRSGPWQIDTMRETARAAEPLLLVDGLGFVHGRWVIESIEEQADTFAPGGTPRRQTFTLQMRYYDDGAQV